MGYYNSIMSNNGGGSNMTMYIIICICCMCVSAIVAVGIIWWMNRDEFVPANEKRDFWGIQ